MLPAEVCGCENFLRKHHLPVRVIKPSDVILWFLVDFFMPTKIQRQYECECISKRLIEITPSWILVKWKCVVSRNFGEFNNNYRFVKNYLLHVGVRMWAEINTCICTSSIILIQNLSLLLPINGNKVYQLLCSLVWPHWVM